MPDESVDEDLASRSESGACGRLGEEAESEILPTVRAGIRGVERKRLGQDPANRDKQRRQGLV